MSNKNKTVNTTAIKVDEKIICYGNTIISVDNISMVTVSSIPNNNSWVLAVILGIIGIIAIEETFGIIMLSFALLWFFGVIYYNRNLGENLAIHLNSGDTLFFYCRDSHFLIKVVDEMIKSIKGDKKSTYIINFEQCRINDIHMTEKNKL